MCFVLKRNGDMKRADVIRAAADACPRASIQAADKDYAKPTQRYLQGKFYKAFREYLNEVAELGYWVAENWDCDDWAAEFRCHASKCHARTRRNSGEGIAVGEVWYTQKKGGGHAINIAIVGGNKVIFIEPQTGKILRLTEGEKCSAWFVRF